MEVVTTFTPKQRAWILRRDRNQCVMRRYVNGKWRRCPNKDHLQVHHIIPRHWCEVHLPPDFPVNGPENLATLCPYCHVGRGMEFPYLDCLHPDVPSALRRYQSGDKEAFKNLKLDRQMQIDSGMPYWNTRFDWLLMNIVRKSNLTQQTPYPCGIRGVTGRRPLRN